MHIFLLLLVLLPHLSCSAPGPLAADRAPGDLFGPSEDNLIVVDAILIVDEPLPPVLLRHTAAPGVPYMAASTALAGASVTIHTDDAVFEYRSDPEASGRYLPPRAAALVEPGRTYELRVETSDGAVVRAMTQTPERMLIGELVLLDREGNELRHLKLFSEIGNQVYEAAENQLEWTKGVLQARFRHDGAAASYQIAVSNLEHFSPLLFDNDWIDEDDVERGETSPPLGLEDGALYLPWDGIFFAGRYKVKLYAVDENWFDLVRTDNVNADRSSGEAGQAFQRPLFHVENGIGLFGSAAVDSVGFSVRPKGTPECTGCECWGCGRRPTGWSGTLDPDTGSGSVRYLKEKGGDKCDLSYEITGAAPAAPCAECSFVWEFTLTDLTIVSDGGGCGGADEAEGQTVRFGQSKEVISPEGGTPEHGLYYYDLRWTRVEEGWSLMPSYGDYEDIWLFGFNDTLWHSVPAIASDRGVRGREVRGSI